MSSLRAFSVHDEKASAFAAPFFFTTKGQAVRGFSDECNRADSHLAAHASDYTLFEVGIFDQATGTFTYYEKPVALGNGLTFKEAK